MQPLFQKCTLLNLDQLVRVSRKTFVDAFEKDNDPKDFRTYCDFAFDKNKLSKELKTPNTTFYFAYIDEQLAGYFKLNEDDAQTDIKSQESIELERIYVLEQFQGEQIGTKMLFKAIEIAFDKNKKHLWLGVWEKNTDAIRFYQKHGFLKFNTHPYYIGKDKQTDWLMRFDLSTFNIDSK